MKVVNLQDSANTLHGILDLVKNDSSRYRLHEDIRRLFDESPGGIEDEPTDQEADKRIGQIPARGQHNERGNYGADRTKGVAHHVEKGAVDIEALMMRPVKDKSGRDIHAKANGGYD